MMIYNGLVLKAPEVVLTNLNRAITECKPRSLLWLRTENLEILHFTWLIRRNFPWRLRFMLLYIRRALDVKSAVKDALSFIGFSFAYPIYKIFWSTFSVLFFVLIYKISTVLYIRVVYTHIFLQYLKFFPSKPCLRYNCLLCGTFLLDDCVFGRVLGKKSLMEVLRTAILYQFWLTSLVGAHFEQERLFLCYIFNSVKVFS